MSGCIIAYDEQTGEAGEFWETRYYRYANGNDVQRSAAANGGLVRWTHARYLVRSGYSAGVTAEQSDDEPPTTFPLVWLAKIERKTGRRR